MIGIAMSRAASGLLRALLRRTAERSDRILLTELQSQDWQSLTFSGERHTIRLRVTGSDAASIVRSLTSGLEDAEFSIPGQIVADIEVASAVSGPDGSVSLTIEALTIAE